MARDERSPAAPAQDSLTLVRPEPRLEGSFEQPTQVAPARDVENPELGEETFERRYRRETLLGEGGMGQVLACEDRRIGREVALKVIRASAAEVAGLRQRFLAEARIQGQLEHPSIVPVYDLGSGPSGPYFTMRRVRGRTLEAVLERLRAGTELEKYPRHRLLRAFVQLAQAVAFAHARGIIHRDLKPANTMLGDYGEVYVLDWGLAKPIAEPGGPHERPRPPSGPPLELADDALGETAAGAIMGTLGYMAPEQLRDEGLLDARTDVYALGAILFEIATKEPLHPRAEAHRLMSSTMDGISATARAAELRGEAPVELVAICARATATHPADRFPTARALHDAIEAFLEGDRDLEQRRKAAVDLVHRAGEILAPAAGRPTAEQSARAVQDLGRALALDPENGDAMSSLVRLLSTPPADVPAAVQVELDASSVNVTREINRVGGWVLLSWFAFLPPLFWMGMRRWEGVIFGSIMIAIASALSMRLARQRRPDMRLDLGVLAAGALGIATAGLVLGPLFLMPGIAAIFAMAFAFKSDWWWSWLGVAAGIATIVVPAALEAAGILPPSMSFEGGEIRLLPVVAEFPRVPTITFLVTTAIGMVVASGLLAGWMRRAIARAEQRMVVQTWLLRQLVPPKARDAIAPRRPTRSQG